MQHRSPDCKNILDTRYKVKIKYNGITYPSVENAYYASEFKNPDDQKRFLMYDPYNAKHYNNIIKAERDPEWINKKYDILYQLLYQKFNDNPDLTDYLLNHTPDKIVYYNLCHDNELGQCTCHICSNKSGRNIIGKLLMQLRNDLNN